AAQGGGHHARRRRGAPGRRGHATAPRPPGNDREGLWHDHHRQRQRRTAGGVHRRRSAPRRRPRGGYQQRHHRPGDDQGLSHGGQGYAGGGGLWHYGNPQDHRPGGGGRQPAAHRGRAYARHPPRRDHLGADFDSSTLRQEQPLTATDRAKA